MGFIWIYGVPKDWIVKLMSALARSGRFVWLFHYPVFQELVLLCLSLPEKMFHLLDLGNIGGAGEKNIYVKRHYILLFRANATPKKSQLGM